MAVRGRGGGRGAGGPGLLSGWGFLSGRSKRPGTDRMTVAQHS